MPAHKTLRRMAATIVRLRLEVSRSDAAIESLRDQVDDLYDQLDRRDQAIARERRRASDAEYDAEQTRDRENRHRWDLYEATKELKKAKEWGDSYACERAVRKLRDLAR